MQLMTMASTNIAANTLNAANMASPTASMPLRIKTTLHPAIVFVPLRIDTFQQIILADFGDFLNVVERAIEIFVRCVEVTADMPDIANFW